MESTRAAHRFPVWLLACLLVVATSAPSDASTLKQPNIVLIVIDTLRASDLSHAGYTRPTSPELDKLAKKSVVFENTVSVGANTSIAMAGLMTGRLPYFEFDHPWNDEYLFGMNRFYTKNGEIGLPSSLDSLAERLQAQGYFTAGVVTNPYLQKIYQFDQGFDVYEELMAESGYVSGDKVSDAALAILDSLAPRPPTLGPRGPGRYGTARPQPPRSPFFLYLHYMDVHWPYGTARDLPVCSKLLNGYAISPPPSFDTKKWIKMEETPPEELQEMLPHIKMLYDCSILRVDAYIGRVLNRLEELNLTDKTIIAVTSDHGEEFLEHGKTAHTGTTYRELLHVPMILSIPGVNAVHVSDLVRNFDLLPTLLDFLGAPTDSEKLDAVSLRPFIEGENETTQRSAYVNFPWVRMYREGDHKLVERANEKFELYDLEADPQELNPRVGKEIPHSLKPLKMRRDSLIDQVRRSGAQVEPTNSTSEEVETQHGADEATRNQLRALGYLD